MKTPEGMLYSNEGAEWWRGFPSHTNQSPLCRLFRKIPHSSKVQVSWERILRATHRTNNNESLGEVRSLVLARTEELQI